MIKEHYGLQIEHNKKKFVGVRSQLETLIFNKKALWFAKISSYGMQNADKINRIINRKFKSVKCLSKIQMII